MKYEVLKDSVLEQRAKTGTIVYKYKGWDYDLASDDSWKYGYEFISVTLDENGGSPFFTIPLMDLKPL